MPSNRYNVKLGAIWCNLISLVKCFFFFNSVYCNMHYLVRRRYRSTERHCLLWCGMLTGDCVFGLGRASVRGVKFVDRAGCGVGEGVYYCCKWVAKRVSKIALGKMFWLSFKWLLAAYSAWMQKCSTVLRCAPFFWYCRISIVLCMVSNECACSIRCWVNSDV